MNSLAFAPANHYHQNSSWKKWLEHLLKNFKNLELREAGLVLHSGLTLSRSKGFKITNKELQHIGNCFCDPTIELISLNGITYCIKVFTPTQLVAFNGARYVVISKTQSMFIILLCSSPKKSRALSDWLKIAASKIIDPQP
ncbi:uncharacterized protein LOC115218133 [Octopus sinensis]|uniref:Uncharacterized protein LOC115218133 n=1 Tax=Octopus sinensis TaxID=2607531 RepID=A0A6P7T040_9MOLL|nr:uncharacterized protein LOC115218133 [Octopus sinensis]